MSNTDKSIKNRWVIRVSEDLSKIDRVVEMV